MKKHLATALLATTIASTAQAYQAGDLIFRAGAAGVFPTEDGTVVAPNGNVEADDAWSLGLTMTYMTTDNLGIGVLAAWPFKHDINGAGSLAAVGKVAETKHLPPTVTLQYHFDSATKLHPYVGAGINYTNFFSTKTTGALTGDKLTLDDSWGVAAELGADYELQNDWLVGAQLWYVDIDTDATITGGNAGLDGTYNVSIDPWVFMLSVGKKF